MFRLRRVYKAFGAVFFAVKNMLLIFSFSFFLFSFFRRSFVVLVRCGLFFDVFFEFCRGGRGRVGGLYSCFMLLLGGVKMLVIVMVFVRSFVRGLSRCNGAKGG